MLLVALIEPLRLLELDEPAWDKKTAVNDVTYSHTKDVLDNKYML